MLLPNGNANLLVQQAIWTKFNQFTPDTDMRLFSRFYGESATYSSSRTAKCRTAFTSKSYAVGNLACDVKAEGRVTFHRNMVR